MRSCEQLLVALATTALIEFVANPALATGAEEDAKTFFAQGRELRLAGNCAEAIVAFRRALEIYPEGLGALRNAAECEESLGRYASARRDWWDLRRAALQSNEARYEGWSDDAESHYKALAGKVGTITVKLVGVEDRPQIRVVMDGKPLDPRLVGVALERDPGQHTIDVLYGGAAPLSRKVELAAGGAEVVTLAVPGSAPAPSTGSGAPVQRAAPSPEAPPGAPSSALRTTAFVGLGVGAAGLAAAAIATGVRAGALSSIEEGCEPAGDGYACPKELEGEYDKGKTASTLASVFSGVALVGLGAGLTLLLIEAPSQGKAAPKGAPGAALSFTPTLGGAGFQLLGRF